MATENAHAEPANDSLPTVVLTPTLPQDGFDEDNMATPTAASVTGNLPFPRYAQHVDDNSFGTSARHERPPVRRTTGSTSSRSSFVLSTSSRSPSLHELASMYQPDEPTQVTVDDGTGAFHNVSLFTPTVESFSSAFNGFEHRAEGSHFDWSAAQHRASRRNKGRSIDFSHLQGRNGQISAMNPMHVANSSSLRRSRSTAPPEQDGRNYTRHSSFEVTNSTPVNATNGRRGSEMSPEDAAQFAKKYSEPRLSTSSSSSSVAESAGTAADAADSDYEEQRSESISKTSSRRPSVQGDVVPSMKRLSSFAPLPALNLQSASSHTNSIAPSDAVHSSAPSHITSSDPTASTPPPTAPDMQTTSSSQSNASTGTEASAVSSQSQTSRPSSPRLSVSVSASSVPSSAIFEKNRREALSPRKSRKPKSSVLEKVMSRTRQHDLPPKPPAEDRDHLKQFQEMMLAAREADKARRAAANQRRLQKEKEANNALSSWQKDILPNWKAVLRDDKLRKTWWSGTMPPMHRAKLWQGCIGNGLAIGKGSYARATTLVQRLQQSKRLPASVLDAIEADIAKTLPQTKLFQEGCPLYSDLKGVLLAQSVFWKGNTPTYTTGTSHPAAMLLISMPANEAFFSLVNLINKSLLKVFYLGAKEDVEAYYRVFSTLLADKMPKVYKNFVAHDIRPALYLRPWLDTVYAAFLGFETTTRLWDIFVLEGDQFLFRLALAILQIFEARLFNPDHTELADLFRGEDRGAKAIVARDTSKADVDVQPWEVYELMGAHEDDIFAVMQKTEWKEATFHRLLLRELPDVAS